MIDRLSAATMLCPLKVWGFGESIVMHALLGADGDARTYAVYLLRRWAKAGAPLSDDPLAHVAPGVPLLELFVQIGEDRLLDRALELGSVLEATVTGTHGARLHRPDLRGWEHEVWVDWMHLDGPFLAQLALVTGEEHWRTWRPVCCSHTRVSSRTTATGCSRMASTMRATRPTVSSAAAARAH